MLLDEECLDSCMDKVIFEQTMYRCNACMVAIATVKSTMGTKQPTC